MKMMTRYWLLTLLLPLAIAHGDFNATKCAFFCFTVPEVRYSQWDRNSHQTILLG